MPIILYVHPAAGERHACRPSGPQLPASRSRESLAGGGETASAADEHQVVVHVDASALSGQGGESEAPLPTVRRLTCDGAVVPVVERDGEILNVGRKQRIVPTAIKRALLARDRTCTWPGCHHRRFIEAHHVHHWADGAETSLSKLILICSHHHALIHEGGFSLQRRADGSCYFAWPDGRPVEAPSAEDGSSSAVASSAEDSASMGGGDSLVEVRDERGVYRIGAPSAEGGVSHLRKVRLDRSLSSTSAAYTLVST